MKTVKIKFVDFWNGFDERENFITSVIEKSFNLEFSENPDYLFFSINGSEHTNYNCVKIFYTGENITPDFNICDYGIAFSRLNFGDRYFRFPFYLTKKKDIDIIFKNKESSVDLINRHFCNFIYSRSNANPIRDEIFIRLSEISFVHSGGKHLNNIGFQVEDKREYIKNFIFTLAIENDEGDGYITEKIIHAFSSNTIPIYWGDNQISNEFNKESFINLKEFNDLHEGIKYVEKVYRNTELQLGILNQEPFTKFQKKKIIEAYQNFESFLQNIFNQNLEHAYRRSFYGFSKSYVKRYNLSKKFYNSKIFKLMISIKNFYNKGK